MFDDVLEMIDVLDELRDKTAIKAVTQGRKAIARSAKGILASKIFKKKKGVKMKSVLFILIALMVMTFAGIAAIAEEEVNPEKTESITGRVIIVLLPDAAEELEYGIIVIMDDAGKRLDIKVPPKTKIFDASKAEISIDKIKKNDRAEIEYTKTEKGVNEARSVNILK